MSAERERVRVWAGEGRVLRDGGSERVRGGVRGCGERARAGAVSARARRALGTSRGHAGRGGGISTGRARLRRLSNTYHLHWSRADLNGRVSACATRRWARMGGGGQVGGGGRAKAGTRGTTRFRAVQVGLLYCSVEDRGTPPRGSGVQFEGAARAHRPSGHWLAVSRRRELGRYVTQDRLTGGVGTSLATVG